MTSFGRIGGRRSLSGLSALLIMSPCAAHHSYAMFDITKTVTLQGTVKQYQWSNPHCYIQLLVAAPSASAEWSIEMSSTGDVYRGGWRPGTFRPGDKVTVVVHPTRDGTNGGSFVSAVGSGGESLVSRKATQ
ncbi:MAG TPA: DUF6152 family protein [Steroidobacteraceae bacterium]|nr:DUF6152 family protein [Steroidobacteraceae bacterium]